MGRHMTISRTSLVHAVLPLAMAWLAGCVESTSFRGHTTLGAKELQQCGPGATKAASAPRVDAPTALATRGTK